MVIDTKALLLKSFKITHVDIINADGEHYMDITYLNNDALNECLSCKPLYDIAFRNCREKQNIKHSAILELAYYLTNRLLVYPCFQLEKHMPDIFNNMGWPPEDCVKVPNLWHCWVAFCTVIATHCVNNSDIQHDDFDKLMDEFCGGIFGSIRVEFFKQLEEVEENIKNGSGEQQLSSTSILQFFSSIISKL